jgi:hypothetical protein
MALEDRFHIREEASPLPPGDQIPTHQFTFLLREYARGKITRAEALSAINGWVVNPLDTAEQGDLSAIADLIDAEGPQVGTMILKAVEVGDVIGLGEIGTEGYATRAEIVAKIGF